MTGQCVCVLLLVWAMLTTMTETTTTSSEIVITTEYGLFLDRYKCRLLVFGFTNSPIKVSHLLEIFKLQWW